MTNPKLPDGYHDALNGQCKLPLTVWHRVAMAAELLLGATVTVTHSFRLRTAEGYVLPDGPGQIGLHVESFISRLWQKTFPPKTEQVGQGPGGYCPASKPEPEVDDAEL